MGSEVIIENKVYFKEKTFVACFRTRNNKADRLMYLHDGADKPTAFIEWLTSMRKDVEDMNGEPATITYANIL